MQKFSKTSDGKKGGLFVGKKHSEGGIPAVVVDTGQPIEVEGGEAIINAEATALHWKELSKINQSTGGVPIPKPSDAEKLLEKFENGGKLTIKDKQTIYQKWKSLVNMSYSELEKYYNSKEGKESGLSKSEADSQGISSGRESARWIMRMKKTNYKSWTSEMWRWANKQISFISRMRGNQGDLYDEKGKKTRKLMSLLIWGHNPKKFNVGGKTIAQTPAPKKERISGSSTNKPETSSSIASAKQIEFSESTITKIRNIVREHNKKHPSKKINLSSAKAVVRRGMGAYSSSHRPTISGGKPNSRVAWGLARLNAFTYKIINGKSKSGKYNQDDDLINELGLKVQKMNKGALIDSNGKIVKPIKQLGTGANVYFETNFYRLNENLKENGYYVLINQQDDPNGVPFTFKFNDFSEAYEVITKLNFYKPNGVQSLYQAEVLIEDILQKKNNINMDSTKPKTKKNKPEFTDKAKKLVPKNQLSALQEIKYREQDEAVANVNENVSLVPDLYGQDKKGKEAVAYLHYFLGGSDWYITEYNEEEYTAFGFVVLNQDWQMAEFGYISMQELTKSMPLNRPSIELDFYWEPATINEIIDKNEPKYNTDEESEIDFIFNPPNQNGIKLLNQLTQFPVEISDQDANFFVLKNAKIGIQFFDNTTEFKFDIFTTSELHNDLQNALRQIDPIASTRGGKLRSYHDIAMDMIELLMDITEVYDSMIINEPGYKIPIKLIELRLGDSTYFYLKSLSEADAKMRELLDTQSFSDLRYSIEWQDGEAYGGTIDCEPRSFFENVKNPFSRHIKTWITNVATKGKDYPSLYKPMDIVFYQTVLAKYEIEPNIETLLDINSYKNPYDLNKAIESFLDTKVGDFVNSKSIELNQEEKLFIKNYTGFGGLGKYGELSVGSMFEFFTPKKVIEKMWALAYKYGYSADKSILETSVGTGEFLQFANPLSRVKAFEINKYSAMITQILYPFCDVNLMPFESNFIKNRDTIKGKIDDLEKFDLIIGNPPYGDFSILDDKATQYLLGFGEQKFTQAKNYVEYFLRRSVDLLNSQGLIVMIIGAEVRGGGTLFLDSGNSPVKEYLAEKCELLDAYRLPDTTFERTGVTSDIIVLRKK